MSEGAGSVLGVGKIPVYDSNRRTTTPGSVAATLWLRRALVRLLVERDLTLRYRRSVLGVAWTLLNPLLTMTAMWLVFSALFRFQTGRTPYLVYLFSGLVVLNFVQQAILQVGSSLTASSGVLARVRVPAEVFAFSSALAAVINMLIAIAVLLVLQVVTGAGVPWTVLLAPLELVALLCMATGAGLILATLAVRFYDALDLAGIFLLMAGYLTPTFYPESIVPAAYRSILHANPLYWHLRVFRELVVEGALPPVGEVAVVAGTALLALGAGVWIFARSWRSLAVML